MAARRVLLLHSSSGRYGADRQLRLIACGLQEDGGFRPLVVLPAEGELVDDLRADGVEVLIRPLGVLRREHLSATGLAGVGVRAGLDAARLWSLVKRRSIGLVHSNTSVVLSGAAAAAAARVPHVWHVREIYADAGPGGALRHAWPAYRSVLQTAAALPCVSAATAGQFAGTRAARRGRVRVIGDGLAVDPVLPARGAARAALGLDERTPVIAVLGRISTWKGQDLLVRALAEPPLAEIGATALIAGAVWQGAYERLAAVRAAARSAGVDDRVRFTGFRDDVQNVYAAADVIAVPSTAPDPLPGAAIEAAAAGCAVLAAAHGGLPEIVTDGVTGVLFAPRDQGALAREARRLLDDPALRARLGAAASAEIRDRFAPRRLIDSLASLYSELLGS
jgi:glycosyltransferase involved in cell wall biosynthesis